VLMTLTLLTAAADSVAFWQSRSHSPNAKSTQIGA
jgi:hypothetical protein